MELLQAVKDTAKALDLKFGRDIVVLEISKISVIADYFIITTGGNPNQIQALAEATEEALQKYGIRARNVEGMREANWVLMDFGDIIVHIFDDENRQYYDLEHTWADAVVMAV